MHLFLWRSPCLFISAILFTLHMAWWPHNNAERNLLERNADIDLAKLRLQRNLTSNTPIAS